MEVTLTPQELKAIAAEVARLMREMKPAPAALPTEKLYTPVVASALIGVHKNTIFNAIKSGRLPATKFANVYQITKSDLETFRRSLRARRKPSQPA